MRRLYVQYGCGLTAPKEWLNFDVSPTLRIQKIPLIGNLIKNKLNIFFPSNVKYGDIIKGLPVNENSCDGIFCSHTLEHLAFDDFRKALKNTYRLLKPGGIFRCILPDLETTAKEYLSSIENGNRKASIDFMNNVLLGMKQRPKGIKKRLGAAFGNAHHLWMWDKYSLEAELEDAGFENIRCCVFNDSSDTMFKLVEDEGRFWHAAAFECTK